MNWFSIINDTGRKTNRQILASIPRNRDVLPVIVSFDCPLNVTPM